MTKKKKKTTSKKKQGTNKITQHRPGRKSKSSKELWERRMQEAVLHSSGYKVMEIARQVGVSHPTVIKDLKALQNIKDPMAAADRVESGYLNVIRRAWRQYENTGDEHIQMKCLDIITSNWEKVANLYGLSRPDVNIQNNILNVMNGENSYDKLDKKDLKEEWKRRQKLLKE